MADALDCGMRTLHAMHLRDPPDWFYDIIPDFLARYDRINNEWRGHAYTRPSFDRPSRDFDPGASSSQQPLAISQKRPREIETTDSPTSPTHDVSYKRPRQVESTDDPVIQQNPVVDPPLVHVEVGDSAPSPSQQDSERSPPPVVEVTTIPPVTQPSPTTPVWVDGANDLYLKMLSNGIQPSLLTLNMMINVLCKGGRVQSAGMILCKIINVIGPGCGSAILVIVGRGI
ncbi:hypothetical protein POM88_005086 [Heracleum sosnowskyi]|uniref:Uncharacterized protein n=1 Tax=Heracleum sosnowskyi TaxID=360622 RepID=A0AAD8NES8_9APIA|nr:hypothetical protein POM88_005086 [Heracleum sosnowskyi]